MGMGEHRRLFQPEWFYGCRMGLKQQHHVQTRSHMGEISSSLSVGTVDPLLPSHPPCAHWCQSPTDKPTDKPWVTQDPLLPRCGGRLGGHRAKLTNRHHQAGDKQEKKFIYIFQAAEQQWRFPGRKLKEQNSVSHTGMWAPAALWSLQCGCGKREIHSTGAEESEGCTAWWDNPGFGPPKCKVQLLEKNLS